MVTAKTVYLYVQIDILNHLLQHPLYSRKSFTLSALPFGLSNELITFQRVLAAVKIYG